MNWADIIVITIIIGFGLAGLASGFVNTIFKIASFFISIFFAVKLYPVMTGILEKTDFFSAVKAYVIKNTFQQKEPLVQEIAGQSHQTAAGTVVDSLPLPGFLKGILLGRVDDASAVMDMGKATDLISNELSSIIISIISLALLYILIRIGLALIHAILKGIFMLPVLKQADKLGGFVLGLVEGLLTVYVLLAVLALFNTSPQFQKVFDAINLSTLANYFYQNNFIINWMF
ncbi:MAG: CvpA family protein [Acetivibrionales bacterium]